MSDLQHSSQCPQCLDVDRLCEGVATLQISVLSSALEPELCQQHGDHKLEFYCQTDNTALCIDCLSHHEKHEVTDLPLALYNAGMALKPKLKQFEESEKYLEQHLQEEKMKTDFLRSTVDVLKQVVLKGEGGLAIYINEDLKSSVEKLDTIYDDRLSDQENYTKHVKEKMESFQLLQKEVKYALHCRQGQQLLTSKDGSLEPWIREVQGIFHSRSDILLFREDCPGGNLVRVTQMTGRVQKMFRCVEDCQAVVLSICMNSLGYIIVAYAHEERALGRLHEYDYGDGWVAKFTPKGTNKGWQRQPIRGRVSVSGLQEGLVRVEGDQFPATNFSSQFFNVDSDSGDKLYDIYTKLSARFVLRVYNLSGSCEIRSVVVNDYQTSDEELFAIHAVSPTAMDASSDGRIFAVLEKEQTRVNIYRFEKQSSADEEILPHAIYVGNGKPFKPQDICFYAIGGKERLVVADWLNSVLHVLDVSDGCDLIGQEGADCRDMRHPTALCPDVRGRLLIGCQGGNILTLSYP